MTASASDAASAAATASASPSASPSASDAAAGAAPARLDPAVARALARGGLVDLTTTGRQTGQPRTVEIVFHAIDGRVYISGIPARQRRSWLANLAADPRLTLRLKSPPGVVLPGRARNIDDEAERRAILPHVAGAWGRDDLEVMVAWSPLIEVILD
ncbi:MAG: nitroreductase/quinone reductase family protein [Candidatus Limnocylindrales bacterium]